jgi:serine protease Do
MSTLAIWTRARSAGALVAALLVGTVLGAGAISLAGPEKSEATPPAAALPQVMTGLSAPSKPTTIVYQSGFADLVERVSPSVVQIATTEPSRQVAMPQMRDFPPGSPFSDMMRQFFGDELGQGMRGRRAPPAHSLGSGFIVDSTGYIVTNNHVIDGAHEVKVTLTDGTSYTAKIIGRDKKTDVGLLKIEAGKALPALQFGDSSRARVGDWVVAVGNPYGLGGTVTAGIISAHGRNINEGPYDDFLQIDAPINPGNSGGPLFDQSGNVIGIDTAIFSPSGGSVGIGFAIPSNIVKPVVAQLRAHGKVDRGWLGVQMQPLTPALATAVGLKTSDGVLIAQITKDSPAAHSELHPGDVITAFNGKKIATTRDLAVAVADAAKGSSVKLTVWRDERERSIDVSIGTQKEDVAASADDKAGAEPAGMTLEPLTAEARSGLGLPASASGVLVAQVAPDGPAAESGVRPGDVIVRIGNDEIKSPAQANEAIREAQRLKKQAIPLLVMREGTTYYVGLQLDAS